MSPLDLILTTMRQRYHGGDIEGAIALARLAAPYLHSRPSTIGAPSTLADIPDADLDKFQPQD